MITRKHLMSALFDTINGNEYDDGLEGWWHSKSLGENRWRIAFSVPVGDDEARDVAEWDVTLIIEEVADA
jgi:hypothetical protein